MGKAAVLGALAVTLTVMSLIYTSQETSRETQIVQSRAASNDVARELAHDGKKLILASWVEAQGALGSAPFQSINQDGGTITVTDFNVSASVMDVTVRAEYNGAVHDIRSRYQWNGYGLNPFQVKAADIDFEISPATELDFDKITLDDQSLKELNDVLISELGLAGSLAELDLGSGKILNNVKNKLNSQGKNQITIELIDAAQRAALEQENGLYFPDQVEQAISSYIASNPNLLTTSPTAPTSFGDGSGTGILKITDDLTVSNLTGSGILIVEGSLVVPTSATLNWDGIVLIKPPSDNFNPQIDFSGTVNINGGLIALHESMPNAGHMDVTTFRDMTGTWASSSGVDKKLYYWPWCMYHKHDFTSAYGNNITYWANTSSKRIHESQIHFNDTLGKLSNSQEIFLEIFNPSTHGRGTLSLELTGEPMAVYPVSSGFEPSVAAPGNAYRTKNFTVNELKYLHIDINRLSSLRKMWDPSSGNYAGCSTNSGPLCVGYDYNRMNALTLRLYTVTSGTEKMVYEASMYWHRRTDEEAAFNDKMDALLDEIKSPDYGLDINLGSNVKIAADNSVLNMLSKLAGGTVGYSHLGTWQKHWDELDANNPVSHEEKSSK